MQNDWQGNPAVRRSLRIGVVGFFVALFGVLAVFIGQGLPNAAIENVGAVIALIGLATTGGATIIGFVLGARSLWRRSS